MFARSAYKWLAILVLAALILQPLTPTIASPGKVIGAGVNPLLTNRSGAASLQQRVSAIIPRADPLPPPTNYDFLHHAASSTPWTEWDGQGVNVVLGNFALQSSPSPA